jgi:hypothetical protein
MTKTIDFTQKVFGTKYCYVYSAYNNPLTYGGGADWPPFVLKANKSKNSLSDKNSKK